MHAVFVPLVFGGPTVFILQEDARIPWNMFVKTPLGFVHFVTKIRCKSIPRARL